MEFLKMKKTILITGLLAVFATLFISCGSTKAVQTDPDEYTPAEPVVSESAEGAETAEDSEADETTNDKSKKQKKQTNGKKKKNAFEQFFTLGNKDDYIIYDQTTVYTKEITGMVEKNANVVIRYDNYMAGFGSYNSAAYYFMQFDQVNRATLAKAAEAYFSDFENKRLQRKGKNTDRAYGRITYRLDWGPLSSTTPNYGTGEGYCGYDFIKGSPYFVVYNYEFNNEYYERAGDATTRTSPFVKFYFTRSQLRQLLSLLSEDTITQQIYDNDPNYIPQHYASDEY